MDIIEVLRSRSTFQGSPSFVFSLSLDLKCSRQSIATLSILPRPSGYRETSVECLVLRAHMNSGLFYHGQE